MTNITNVIHRGPIVIVPQRVLEAMIADTQRHREPETGESMVGIIIPPQDPFHEPTFIVLGTIPSGDALRHTHMFELGGDFQVRVFDWLSQNWDCQRELSRQKPEYSTHGWGVKIPPGLIPKLYDRPLEHVGDWHKHPDGLTHPSSGDWGTAVNMLKDPALTIDYLISPIVTYRGSSDRRFGWNGSMVTHDGATSQMQISFSYISERMLQMGFSNFIEIQPHIVPDYFVPALPPLAWDLADPGRLRLELSLLKEVYHCEVETYYRETRGGPLLEVCFEIRRPKCWRPWDYRLLIETSANYPASTPGVRIIKGEAPEAAQVPSVVAAPQPVQRNVLRWLRDAVANAPLVNFSAPQTELPPLTQQDPPGQLVWRGTESTLLTVVTYLERRGMVWKPETNGTESTATSEK